MNRVIAWFSEKSLFNKIFTLGVIFGLLGFLAILTLRLSVKIPSIGKIPTLSQIRQIQNPLTSELYSADGKLIGSFFKENRSYLESEEVNDYFRDALITTEDARFYSHNGVDKRSLVRVFFKTLLLSRESSGGGSTLTQQLAKNLYPRRRYKILSTVVNKFREIEIAKKIETLYSKEEILLMYANTVSFGERAFGLKTAAQRFYDKAPVDLSLDEAATLVGILKATSYYSPRRNPERAQARRNVVLNQMVKYEKLTEAEATEASKLPIKLTYNSPSKDFQFAAYFKQEVRKEFDRWKKDQGSKHKKVDLDTDGLKITTTLDYDLQIAAEAIMEDHMRNLQKIFIQSWEGADILEGNNQIITDKLTGLNSYRQLKESGKSSAQAKEILSKKESKSVWTWEGFEKQSLSSIDSIQHYLSLLHTGILAKSTQTGDVKAWVGGIDYSQFQYDNVKGGRQVGSTFKPIVYLTALTKGVQPCDEFTNELRTYTDFQDWTPKNSDDNYGDIVTMKGALAQSINTVSVQVLFRAGIESVVEMAANLGITSKLNAVPSLVLGTSDVSVLEMVNAYSTLANDGRKTKTQTILKIEDKEGRILYSLDRPEAEQVVEEHYAQTLNGMLQNATLNGTGARLYSQYGITGPMMGKTGTTQNQSDGWFIAYNKDLTIGAWVGTQDRRIHFRYLGHGAGSRSALPMVASLFQYAQSKGKLTPQDIDRTYVDQCFDRLTPEELVERRRQERINKKGALEKVLEDIFANKDQRNRYPSPRSSQYPNRRRQTTQSQDNFNIDKAVSRWESRLAEFEEKVRKNSEERKRKKRR